MTYRVWCNTCLNHGDVPTVEDAANWESEHRKRYPGHDAGAEPYPFMLEPIDPMKATKGEFQ